MGVFIISIFDFFIPRFCPSCRERLESSVSFVCDNCLSSIKKADKKRLRLEYNRKFADSGIIYDFTSSFIFEKDKTLQHIIHSLKYGKKFMLGIFLGRLLGETIKKDFAQYKIDIIVPVPLHHLKKAEREFNQSFYIAKGISRVTGTGLNTRQIKRKRYTDSQTSMNLARRNENLRDAFAAGKRLHGENILLVDDVITTGATVSECGRVLLDAGAGKIYAASVAIAD